MTSGRFPVILMWHMHQPHYRDALSGEYVLPWTYLHAIKDYVDMAAHLESNPSARAVFNFTPVLLDQLQDLADKVHAHLLTGSRIPDPILSLLGPSPLPSDPSARLNLIRWCLRAQRKHLIERFGPYLELATLAESFDTPERAMYASDQFIYDLAVWYHLAWMGETVRRTDVRILALTEQGRGFSAAQRRDLLTLVGELLLSIVPRYRHLQQNGQIELSVSPYGHPILPLLIDLQAGRESAPGSPLPKHAEYPGGAARAEWHVDESVRVFQDAFGERPHGCWPSEGAISQKTLELLDRRGFEWTASSNGVLPQDARDPDRPRSLPGLKLTGFFRDDTLSDLIGFSYATWHGDDAAQHFVQELLRVARRYNNDGTHALLIALDGENAWEHYPFNGYYFLRALYALLADHPQLELVTPTDCIRRGITPSPLSHVVAGSWVHGTLATWIGDPEKNAGWDLLCEAKIAYDTVMSTDRLTRAQRDAASRQLALCESSDWFWWFGDYNPQDAVSQFDQLYRHQLTNLYRLLGLPVPESLSVPISTGRGAPEHGGVMRRATAN